MVPRSRPRAARSAASPQGDPLPHPRGQRRRRIWTMAAGLLAAGVLAACTSSTQAGGPPSTAPGAGLAGIHKIRHVIVVMQENRSFDSYFGTYPGADGIPMRNG